MRQWQQSGFTLIELVMVIVLLGILSVVAVINWPSGLEERAALFEFKRAVRFAQHTAMTRQFVSAATAWGITVSSNSYTVQQKGLPATAHSEHDNRALPDNTTLGPDGTSVWFNGLGEPIDGSGQPLSATVTFSIGSTSLSVCPQTGFAKEGGSCP